MFLAANTTGVATALSACWGIISAWRCTTYPDSLTDASLQTAGCYAYTVPAMAPIDPGGVHLLCPAAIFGGVLLHNLSSPLWRVGSLLTGLLVAVTGQSRARTVPPSPGRTV